MADSKLDAKMVFRPFVVNAERAFQPSLAPPKFSDALIFIDTNVLLAPYRTTKETLGEIKGAYELLKKEGRLRIPGQVAREFAKNRPAMVASVYKKVADYKSISIGGYESPAILKNIPQSVEAEAEMNKIKESIKAYQKLLGHLLNDVKGWQQSDPVIDVYKDIFDAKTIVELRMEVSLLESIRKARYESKIPPGYKDKGKDDGGVGDLAIWLTIIQECESLARDAILVSEDSKEDWLHASESGSVFPRHELTEEFASATANKSFGIMKLSGLLEAVGANKEAIKEVRRAETNKADSISFAERFGDFLKDARTRFTSAFGNILGSIEFRRDFPDCVLMYEDRVYGVEVISVANIISLRTKIDRTLERAIDYARSGSVHALLVVVYLLDEVLAQKTMDYVATKIRAGQRVHFVVVHAKDGETIVLLNESDSPLFQRAYPVD